MASDRSSPFDDLLADSKRQFEELLGGRPAPAAKPAARQGKQATPTAQTESGESQTVRGTANGIPFTLRTR